MRTILIRILTAGMTVSTFYAQSLTSARYRVTDLGTFGGTFSIAFGVSNAGRVGGAAALPNGNVHPYITGLGGTKYDLGTLGGPNGQASGSYGRDGVAIVSETLTGPPVDTRFTCRSTSISR